MKLITHSTSQTREVWRLKKNSSAGFIQANDVYKWKSTFAVYTAAVSMTKLMVTTMIESNIVYLAMVVITMVSLRMY